MKLLHLLAYMFLFIITDYNGGFIIMDGSIGLHLQIP